MNPKERTIAAIASARNDLEAALLHIQHLPAFDANNVGFAANALNNYLTVIDGTTQLLQIALQPQADEEVGRWLDGLRHTTELMMHTVSQLMNMAGPGSPTPKLTETNLPVLVERACAYYRRIAGRKQIRIEFKSISEVPVVLVDRVFLAAALDNLLSNAVKYTPPGKTIHVGVQSEPGHLVCSVRDEGPGISPADQAKLFQKGVRLSAVPTGGEPSTGYGLAVAKEMVEQIGGEIGCESQTSTGACFFIRLPTVP